MPIPALLLDDTGTVIDVNEAFVEFGRQTKPLEPDSNHSGLSLLKFVNTPGGMESLQALIDAMLQRGELGAIEGAVVENGHTATVVVRGTPLEDGDEHTIGGVLVARGYHRAPTSRKAPSQPSLKSATRGWTCATSEDIERGLLALPDALRELAVPFEDYGVNLIDPESKDTSLWFHSMRTDKRWGQVEPDAGALISRPRSGRRAKRPTAVTSIRKIPTAKARKTISIWGTMFVQSSRVPFSHGPLAVNNARPNAFSQTDIDILEDEDPLVRQLRSQLAMNGEDNTSFDITFSDQPSTTLL
ncbi:MAG: hypothetical protein HOL51_16720 [Gemmatimonadetes bacterium]|nr:hypothetical protein [Gemmatimonadota bacterium]MBT7586378.1 hypothetical protein [Gemmatimonadota bacterium]